MPRSFSPLLFFLYPCYAALPCVAQEQPTVSGDRVSSAIAQIEPYIRASLAKTKVPGVAVAVIYNDQIVLLHGYGVRKIGEPAPIDPDTVFEIASLSKPIASSIVASLVGEGKLSWDDRIVDLDPSFQLSDPNTTRQVTIRDFLSHRSGLATVSGDLLEDLGYSRPEILRRMRYLPLPGQFRKKYAYSNFGYTTGAIAAATKIGKPWETIAEEELYSRLGMSSTSSRFSDYENRTNKAALHILLDTLAPAENAPSVRALLDAITGDPVLCVLVAAGLTFSLVNAGDTAPSCAAKTRPCKLVDCRDPL